MATEWITTKEASEILGVSIRTIQRYVKDKKLKAKTVNGRGVVKKDAISKLSKESGKEIEETTVQEKNDTKSDLSVPDGYILIDKETLDSLRIQIKSLTDSVGQMQLTQKLLIEKGLNLKEPETPAAIDEPYAMAPIEEELVAAALAPVTTPVEETIPTRPISELAKVHDEFFQKNSDQERDSLIKTSMIIGGMIIICAVIIFVGLKYLIA